MIIFPVLLLACISLTVDAACDTNAMKACYQTYFKALGFPGTPFPPDPTGFDDALTKKMKQTTDGANITCNAHSDLSKCLGSTSDCITYDTIAKALGGTDNNTAANYVGEFFLLQYICGDGMEGLFFYRSKNNELI